MSGVFSSGGAGTEKVSAVLRKGLQAKGKELHRNRKEQVVVRG